MKDVGLKELCSEENTFGFDKIMNVHLCLPMLTMSERPSSMLS